MKRMFPLLMFILVTLPACRTTAPVSTPQEQAESPKAAPRDVKQKSELQESLIRRGVAHNVLGKSASCMLAYTPFSPSAPAFNTEEYQAINENIFHRTTDAPLSTFSIDVDVASYANARRFLTGNQLPPKDAVRIEEFINYFRYDYDAPKNGEPVSIHADAASCSWAPQHRLVRIGIKGREIETKGLPTNNLTFLVDVSGSMMDPNKLPLIKSAFRLLVQELRKQDKVALVVYAGNAGLVLPPTSGHEKEKILAAVDKLEAGGSTAGGAGIQLAYDTAKKHFVKGGNNRVILATDGDFNVGTLSEGELIRLIEEKRNHGIFLTVLGFGTGNYKDSKMEQLADKGNGNYAYIDNLLEAKKVLVTEMGSTLFTIAKDVKIQVEFNPAQVQAYRLVGYENRLLNNEDFNDDKKDAGELGAGGTVTALYEVVPVGVKSTLPGVDPLKYQVPMTISDGPITDEILTVKFRYKEPTGSVSKLVQRVLRDERIELSQASDDFRFASAVAGFGMLLRDSEFKQDLTYDQIASLAKGAMGEDSDGYRAEFIKLVRTAQTIAATQTAMR